MTHRIRTDCRLCGAADVQRVLTLADTPAANEFVSADELGRDQDRYPLYLVRCRSCGHVQLPVVVDPVRLFSKYVYVSGTSPAFVDHFRRYAQSMVELHHLLPGDLVVEIGSNDGTLLGFFKAAGMRVLGIDPAQRIAQAASDSGIPTLPEFFTEDLARQIRHEHGVAALVVANNVFAHADDLHGIGRGVAHLLAPGRGRFVFEVQYLLDLIEHSLFDMVYHEHLSYHHVAPLLPFMRSLSLELVDVVRVPTHGGSIRVTAAPQGAPVQQALDEFLAAEASWLAAHPWQELRERIDRVKVQLTHFIRQARERGQVVAGFGAPAKLTTLTCEFGIAGSDIAYVIDDSPWKQGLFTPGSHMPVVASAELRARPPDWIVVFAWNFAEQIMAKNPDFAGKFVVPLPEFRIR